MGSLIGRRLVCIGRWCGGWIALRGGLIFVPSIKTTESRDGETRRSKDEILYTRECFCFAAWDGAYEADDKLVVMRI